MKPLSPKMIELLAIMREGKGKVHFSPYMGRFNPNAHYFCFGLKGRTNRCTSAAQGLMDRGLAERKYENKYSDRHELILTDAGKKLELPKAPK